MAKLLQTNLPFATGPNVTAETFNQLVRTLEINLGSIDPDNTLQLTTAERDTLNFNIGQIIYNTTTTTLQYWDGTNFQNISALGAVNLNVSDGSATIGINLGTQTLSLIGGTGITSNATGTSVTFAIDNTVVTLTGTQTLTNKTLTSPTLTSPVLNGTLSGSAFLDEDNMASNSATSVASQQSIKAYVDSQVGTVDTLAEILANGNTTGGTDIAVSANDDITFADTSKALFGNGGDFQIFHNATNNVLNSVNGATIFQLSGSEKGRFSSTGLSVSGAVGITGNFNTSLGGYQVGGTTVIDSSRNLTNIGTISSGEITSAGSGDQDLIINSTNSSKARILLQENGTTKIFIENKANSVSGQFGIYSAAASKYAFLIDASGNTSLNGGTLTSGAITSSGLVTADELSVTNDSTFNGSVDASGQEVTAGTYVINNIAVNGSSTATTSATTQVAVDTVSKTAFRTVKYLVQITNSTDNEYHATEILVTHDGTTPSMTEYATIFTGTAEEATFSADISGSNLRLLATPASTDSMTFKITRTGIKV